MTDFINKIVSIILIFVMLVLAPLVISYRTDDMIAKRAILNEVNTFIDRITDSGVIKASDVDELYMICNSHGLVVDVNVDRLVYALTIAPNDETGNNDYIYDYVVDKSFMSSTVSLNPGDLIKVTVEEKTQSPGRLLVYKLLGVDEGYFKISLCGMVG